MGSEMCIRDRSRGASVIDCATERQAVVAAIDQALTEEFCVIVKASKNPYGKKGASGEALAILKKADRTGIVVKKFYDIQSR